MKKIALAIALIYSTAGFAAEAGIGGIFSNDSKSGSERGRSTDQAGVEWAMQAMATSPDPLMRQCHQLISTQIQTAVSEDPDENHEYASRVCAVAAQCSVATSKAVDLLLKKHKGVGLIAIDDPKVQESVRNIPFEQLLAEAKQKIGASRDRFIENTTKGKWWWQGSPWVFEQKETMVVAYYNGTTWFDGAKQVEGKTISLKQSGSSSTSSGVQVSNEGRIGGRK
jgi:hypothetical protein